MERKIKKEEETIIASTGTELLRKEEIYYICQKTIKFDFYTHHNSI